MYKGSVVVLGKIVLICGVISAIGAGIALMAEDMFFVGLITMVIGIACSYVGSIPYRAIGELYDMVGYMNGTRAAREGFTRTNSTTPRYTAPSTAAKVSDLVPLTKETFIEGALEFSHAQGTMGYAKKKFAMLDDETRLELADIAKLIDAGDAEALRSAIVLKKLQLKG